MLGEASRDGAPELEGMVVSSTASTSLTCGGSCCDAGGEGGCCGCDCCAGRGCCRVVSSVSGHVDEKVYGGWGSGADGVGMVM